MDERRDDWRHGVDENLASLNAGQRVWEHEFKTLKRAQASIDKLLRGDPEKDTDGLIARLHHQETEINHLKAVVDVDKAGNKGIVHRVEELESREKTTVEVWKFWVAILGFIGAILVAIITNLDKIERFLNKNGLSHSMEQKKTGTSRVRYHHYTIHVSSSGDTRTTSP